MAVQKKIKTFWVIITFFILIILISGGSVVAYFVHYSATNERVCEQCHKEIIALWKKSKGHPHDKTRCYECHSNSHNIIPDNWNIFKHARDLIAPPEYLADDTLTSQRCLECHDDILDWKYKVKKKVINFTHRYHYDEFLECVDCHRTAGHDYMADSTNRPSVTECLDCHIKEFEGPPKSWKCLNCHDVMLAPGKTWQLGINSND